MPTYDYKCVDCDNRFEVFQKMSDDPITECPDCGGEVRKLISGGAGIVFKGSGFYVNDYKDKGTKTNAAPKSKETTTSEKKSENKTETKSSEAVSTGKDA